MDVFADIASEAMTSVWNKTPRPFQKDVIARIMSMHCGTNYPQASLLVQPTGCGKSSVYQTIGAIDGGVVLILETTLSLGADQAQKIESISSQTGSIKAYQLDGIKSIASRNNLIQHLKTFTPSSHNTVFLFSSPEMLTTSHWTSLMIHLIGKKVLKLICIDEVHQYLSFGLTFRKSFCSLKRRIFDQVVDKKNVLNRPDELPIYLKVPLLCMTATFNSTLVNLLEKMVGIRFLPSNYFWSNRRNMEKRNIKIEFVCTVQSLRVVKKSILSCLSKDTQKKCIIYSNTATSLESLKERIDSWLDTEVNIPTLIIPGDTLLITGNIEPELKLAYTESFTTPFKQTTQHQFSPRILLATASCIGAGLDCHDVYSVIRIGFPSSTLDLIQEMGRCGRGRSSNDTIPTDNYVLIINLSDFIYMYERIYTKEKSDEPEKPYYVKMRNEVITETDQMQQQVDNLMELLKLLVLNSGQCIHYCLERSVSSPMESIPNDVSGDTCIHSCPVCDGSMKHNVLPIKKKGLQDFLLDTFIVRPPSAPIDANTLLTKLNSFPNVGDKIYARKKSTKAPDNKYLQITILQMIASKLIVPNCTVENPKVTFTLGVHENRKPYYVIDSVWEGFTLIN